MGPRGIAVALAAAAVLTTASAAPARADWSGDRHADVLGVAGDGRLLLWRGNGRSGWAAGAQAIGSGWGQFSRLVAPGDWSGDGRPDLLAVHPDGRLLMYRGSGSGGFATGIPQQIGSGWAAFTALLTPRDWSGDGRPDLLARHEDGRLLMYRGDGDGGFATGRAEQIGTGWGQFTALFSPGDFSGDGKADVLARHSDGRLLMYRGNGAGRWITGRPEQIGTGWGQFTALFSGGDFSGDGKADVLARHSDGRLLMYRGNGAGRWATGRPEQVGTGWNGYGNLLLAWDPPPPAPPPPPPAPPSAPLPDGIAKLRAGLRCTPPGGRLRVNLKIRRRSGRARPRVRRVVFFVRNGPKKVDRRAPYRAALRMRRPAGHEGRVYARVVFRRTGERKLRRKTVSRRYVICG
jgi:hypothetical protein